MPKKIAFLFLIYDVINQEEIWKEFFSQDKTNRHSIYIHYKFNSHLKYMNKFKLDNCIKTQWGHISLVSAQNILLKKALEDADNDMFIFCSGACVPMKTFDYIYNFLDREYSYFSMRPDNECFPRCDRALQFVNQKFIQKASQWCILTKKHAEVITSSDDYLEWFKDTIGDEHCYITYLNYKGLEKETIRTFDSAEDATTFTNWPNVKYKYRVKFDNNIFTLKTYTHITVEELLHLYHSKCLFGRKFDPMCDLTLLRRILRFDSKTDLRRIGILNDYRAEKRRLNTQPGKVNLSNLIGCERK